MQKENSKLPKTKKLLFSYLFFFFLCNCQNEKDSLDSTLENSEIASPYLYLIPKPYHIIAEESYFQLKFRSEFSKEKLKNILKKSKLSIKDLESNPSLEFKDQDFKFSITHGPTVHFTNREYDTEIPLLFYGPKFFEEGIYLQAANHQNIAPTLANLIGLSQDSFREKPLGIQKPDAKIPKLVVSIVIDQGGFSLLSTHKNSFPFLAKLMRHSAYFPKAKVSHVEAHTAVSHAAIGTGSFPKWNGVHGNETIRLKNGKVAYTKIYEPSKDALDFSELKTKTFAEILDEKFQEKPVIISQCYALRASVGVAGFRGKDKDFVYWQTKGKWTTDPKHFQLPRSVSRFPNLDYTNAETTLSSSLQVESETELFLNTIRETILSTDYSKNLFPHFAHVTLKSTDASGHIHGAESENTARVLEATDQSIQKIFEFLQEHFQDQFVVVITADHGVSPLPELNGGDRLSYEKIVAEVQSLLPDLVREKESLIQVGTNSTVVVNTETMKKYNISIHAIREKLLQIQNRFGKSFFEDVLVR